MDITVDQLLLRERDELSGADFDDALRGSHS
jgi:hypothetical protein